MNSSNLPLQIFCLYDECNFTTKYQQTLNRHIKSIYLQIKYSCDICEFTAKKNATVKKHYLNTHQTILYSCHLCEFNSYKDCHLAEAVLARYQPPPPFPPPLFLKMVKPKVIAT